MRILVAEDYAPLRLALVKGLREAGFAVDATADGADAEWQASSTDFDAIVLDLMLPGKDGLSVLASLRAKDVRTPVLILTAKDTIPDKIAGLDRGADDYLAKPFDFGELLARLRALTRRQHPAKTSTIVVGDLSIDRATRTAARQGQAIELSAREYALLELLAVRAGEVVTRTEIWEKLYDQTSEASSNVVDVYVGFLRRKIERVGWPRLLHTRRGQGYLLAPEA